MKSKIVMAMVLLASSPATAQQQPQQTPFEQALSTKLLQEIQSGLTCSTQMVTVQAELAKAQLKIKEIEAAREEKK